MRMYSLTLAISHTPLSSWSAEPPVTFYSHTSQHQRGSGSCSETDELERKNEKGTAQLSSDHTPSPFIAADTLFLNEINSGVSRDPKKLNILLVVSLSRVSLSSRWAMARSNYIPAMPASKQFT